MEKVEILAPAGDMESLRVAINNGADAIYLGMQNFNARQRADNFTTENIKDVVNYAHLYGVKIYLTVNTLVNNSEMSSLIDTVGAAVRAGVDAYLVQDFGVLSVLKECFPGINIHASTQMGIHNLRGAKMAEKLGISRVVLSREAKLQDIIDIKKNTNLEIEYFVQGALCVAFSGNCYFSAFATNDSGNRGMCKQLCRMKYSPNNMNEEYMLSCRDLCLIENLKELIDAGVCSFKIEGRLRRPGYVGQAIHSYRQVVDSIYQNKKLDINKAKYNLTKVFSRGEFNTRAYLDNGVPDNVINKKVQNHLGVPIGKVLNVTPFKNLYKVLIQSKQPLHSGDGLKMLDNGKQILSLGVGNVENNGNNEYTIYTTHRIKVGYQVNLILDYDAEKINIDRQSKIPIKVSIMAKVGEPLICEIKCRDIQCQYISDYICEKANKTPTIDSEIINQFSKLGDTNFCIQNINVDTNYVFLPKSILNQFRRDAIQKLQQVIIQNNTNYIDFDESKIQQLKSQKFISTMKNKIQKIIIIDEYTNINIPSDYVVILAPTKYTINIVGEFVAKYKEYNIGLFMPIIANSKDLGMLDNILTNYPDLIILANNIYALDYLDEDRTVIAGTGLNIFNNFAKDFMLKLGISDVVLSVEQCLDNFCIDNDVYIYSLGQFTLMSFCHCPFKTTYNNSCSECSFGTLNYTNEQGKIYPIRRYNISQCYFELLNNNVIDNREYHHYNQYLDIRNLDIDNIHNIQLNDTIIGKIKKPVK